MAIRKNRKKSGIIYFAENNRVDGMVKIGKTIESADKRLEFANKRNEFMIGRWSIKQKVVTNNVKRTEELAHKYFEKNHDKDSVSKEIFYIPKGWTVKKMADTIRLKDKEYKEYLKTIEREKKIIKETQKSVSENIFNFKEEE